MKSRYGATWGGLPPPPRLGRQPRVARAVRVDVVCPGERRGVDQPVAKAAGNRAHRVARPRIAAGQQPIDDVRRNPGAQPNQVFGGGDALAVIHPQADDRRAHVPHAGEDLHVAFRGDAGDGGNVAIRPRLTDADREAVAEGEACEH